MDNDTIEAIKKIIDNGLTAEVKRKQDGDIVVLEVKKCKRLQQKAPQQNTGLSK